MSDIRGCRGLVLAAGLFLVSFTARADVYEAAQAYEKKDFARSFELYRELAELGQAEAQETLAVMYVNGEGVKRDNALGYAWAKIALEQGAHEAAKGIADQLEPHVTESARPRIAALQAQFGKEALQKTLLPVAQVVESRASYPPSKCNMTKPANPDDYYPPDAIVHGISGSVFIDAKIWGDGRAHDPRAAYSIPEQLFEAAGRAAALHNGHGRPIENGVAVPCSLRFKVKFTIRGATSADRVFENVDDVRKRAEGGDARAQLLYALMLDLRPELNTTNEKLIWWFLKAAQAGIPAAQYKVGFQLLSGFIVEKDEAKATMWLDKAASAGNLDAQIALANYYLRDMSDAAKVAKGAAWFERALEKSLEARFYLSALLASNPDAALRNPQRALDIVKEGLESYDINPIAFEIRAAAQANLGNFAGAQKNQTKAVEMAKSLGWDTTPQKARLEGYQANRAWTGDLFALY